MESVVRGAISCSWLTTIISWRIYSVQVRPRGNDNVYVLLCFLLFTLFSHFNIINLDIFSLLIILGARYLCVLINIGGNYYHNIFIFNLNYLILYYLII